MFSSKRNIVALFVALFALIALMSIVTVQEDLPQDGQNHTESTACAEPTEVLEPTPHGTEAPEGAPGGTVTCPDDGKPNPKYDGSEPSSGTNEGTTNDPDSDEADTGESDKAPNPSTKQMWQEV